MVELQRFSRGLLVALALLAAASGCARRRSHVLRITPRVTPATTLRDVTRAESRAADWVRELTDQVGARLAGSPGDARAVAWGVAKMKALGFANVHTEPVTVPHWERGVETGDVVSPARHRLAITALGGSVPTPEAGLEGDLLEVDSLEALDALPVDAAKGKVVFFDKPTPRRRDGSGYGTAVDVRGLGPSRAAMRGAIGVVVRSIATSDSRLPHTGALRYLSDAPKIPAAALGVPDAQLLHRLIEAGGPVRIRFTLGCKSLADAESANVIGDVVGAGRPDEIVLLGAHLDSWDLGTGALDDGAGVGIVLEAARQISVQPKRPRRTVRVVLFANEENGLRGATAYATAHEKELERHVVALEADSGTGRAWAISYLAGPKAAKAMAAVSAPLRLLGIGLPKGDARHSGADISTLRERGVPVVGIEQDATRYFDIHHSADDTFDKIDEKDLAQVAAAFATFAFGAAEMEGDFGRIPEEKRKGR